MAQPELDRFAFATGVTIVVMVLAALFLVVGTLRGPPDPPPPVSAGPGAIVAHCALGVPDPRCLEGH